MLEVRVIGFNFKGDDNEKKARKIERILKEELLNLQSDASRYIKRIEKIYDLNGDLKYIFLWHTDFIPREERT